MFDPVIFDNLKVVLEGAVYDLDMSGNLCIISRSDVIDLSSVSRNYSIGFRAHASASPSAEILLTATLTDLAAELLNGETQEAGCLIEIKFYTSSLNPQALCAMIQKEFTAQWEGRPILRQTVSYVYEENDPRSDITVILMFGRKLNEQNAEDLPRLVEYTLQSLQWLSEHN